MTNPDHAIVRCPAVRTAKRALQRRRHHSFKIAAYHRRSNSHIGSLLDYLVCALQDTLSPLVIPSILSLKFSSKRF